MTAERSATGRARAELDDLTLVRAQRGEPVALRRVVEHHTPAVFALLSRMLVGRSTQGGVDDLAQEAFIRVIEALPRFDPLRGGRLSSWILTIAARLAIDAMRRPEMAAFDESLAGAAPGLSPEAAADRSRLRIAITRAIADLPPEFRAVFLLRELHELELAEIAALLEIELGTVKSRLHRARAGLKEALAEVHHGG
jgi:RNA polymerase sigma-70 factor (ECF subfamily)